MTKYNIWDIVLYWEKSLFCEWFPINLEIMSNRKLWLFWFYYYTRIKERTYDWIAEWKTMRVRERGIEYIVSTNKK